MAVIVDTSEVQRWGGLMAAEAAKIVSRVTPEVAAAQSRVIAGAMADVPRGATGALAGSIRPLGGGLRRRVKAGSGKAYYARFQEFGTRKMAAHPFLLKQANAGALAVFERQVDDAIGRGEVYG